MPEPRAQRSLWVVSLGLALGLLAPGRAGADLDENVQRLRSMPRAERAALAEKLKQFEALPRAEKESIRQLDDQIARRSPQEQAAYRAVLRRYHLWLQSLPESQRAELDSAAPDQRMALVSKRYNQPGAGRSSSPGSLDMLPLLDLRAPSPHELADEVRLWGKLTAAQRQELAQLTSESERQDRLTDLARDYHMDRTEQESHLAKSEVDALIVQVKEAFRTRDWGITLVKKAAEKDKRAKHTDPSTRETREWRRIAENYHFVVNPPAPTDVAHLERFNGSLPPWIRSLFDHLPPEEARRRLTVLYRVLYPAPKEMPEPPRPRPSSESKPKPPATPAPRPAPTGPASPF